MHKALISIVAATQVLTTVVADYSGAISPRWTFYPEPPLKVPNPQVPCVWDALEVLSGQHTSPFPMYSTIPRTSFRCDQVDYPGFYADEETDCQVAHFCDLDGGKESALCPIGTRFNQITLVCDWWYNIDCSRSRQFRNYSNPRLYHADWFLLDECDSNSSTLSTPAPPQDSDYNEGGRTRRPRPTIPTEPPGYAYETVMEETSKPTTERAAKITEKRTGRPIGGATAKPMKPAKSTTELNTEKSKKTTTQRPTVPSRPPMTQKRQTTTEQQTDTKEEEFEEELTAIQTTRQPATKRMTRLSTRKPSRRPSKPSNDEDDDAQAGTNRGGEGGTIIFNGDIIQSHFQIWNRIANTTDEPEIDTGNSTSIMPPT